MHSKNDAISLGVYLTEQSIHWIEIEKNQSAIHCLTAENYVGPLNNDTEIIMHLNQLLKNKKTAIKKIYTCLPAQNILKKKVEFSPFLTEEDIWTEIHLNTKHYFPDIVEKLTFDIVPLKNNLTKNKKEYYLFAVRTQELQHIHHILSSVELIPEKIEIDHYALLRLVYYLNPIDLKTNQANLLLNFTDNIRLLAYDKEEILYDRYLCPLLPNHSIQSSFENNLNSFCSAFPSYAIQEIQILSSLNQDSQLKEIRAVTQAIPINKLELSKIIHEKKIHPIALGLALKKYDNEY